MKKTTAFVLAVIILLLSCFLVAVKDIYIKEPYDSIVIRDGHLFEENESMNEPQAQYAVKLFGKVHELYLSDNECYFVLIPDKYMYLCDKKDDYDEYFSYIKKNLSFVNMIEVYDLIKADDYYFTDMHLRQEKMIDVAQVISDSMENDCELRFKTVSVECDFYGNYADDLKKKTSPDKIYYLTNESIESLYTEGKVSIYDFEKLKTDDEYAFFLSGNQSVVTIKNENAKNERRLVVFRDSFASPFAPMLAESYSEVVLIDLRYIMSDYVGEYVSFENADVLFMYSTTLINNSLCMR